MCFSATVYVDGKRAGTAANRGQGGCNEYHWADRELGKRLERYAEEQDLKYDFDRLDQIIDPLVADTLENQKLRRLCRKVTVFALASDSLGEWRTLNAPYGEAAKTWVARKYGNKVREFANDRFVELREEP